MGFTPLRIKPLEKAKHIFSHVEWQMSGYLIQVAGMEQTPEGLLLVEKEQLQRKYAIPAAYAAYMRALHMETENPNRL